MAIIAGVSARRLIVLLLDVLLVAGVAGYILWQESGAKRGPTATAEAKQQSTTRAGKRAQAREVRTALRRLESDPASLVASASKETVGDRARQAVPAGSKVTPRSRTWSPDGLGGGTMTVRVAPPGKPAVSYTAVMVREAGGWKVLATIPQAKP